MKNREYTIISVYTQANGEKIAVSMLHTTKKGYFETTKPTAAVEKYGKIEGEINSYWGKLPVVLVPVEQFAALKKEYEIIEYRGPVECTRIRESKPRPDAAALKLYKVFAADAAAPRRLDADGYPVEITVNGYRFQSGNGESLLKALKREYNFTKSDIAAADALTLDNTAADTAEQPAAPVVDTPAANDTKPAAAPLIQAAKETGHLIICSVPKAEQPAAPVVEDIAAAVDAHFADMVANAPADDSPTPSSQKTETPPASQKTAEQLETERIEKVITDYECGIYPRWYVKNLHCESDYFFNCDVISWGRKQIKVKNLETGKNKIFPYDWFIRVVERGKYIVSMPYDAEYMAILKHKQQQPAALTDADVLAAAARIKSNYDAMKQQAAADTFADAITAYCAALEQPAAPVWSPEVIILKEQPAAPAVDAAPAPRHRRRMNIAPRLSRWLHPARWVAVAFVVCLLSGFLLGMNTSTAADAAADDIAAVYELHPVTVTAEAVTDAPATPSPAKKLAAPSPVKNVVADAVTLPGQKTADDMATATAPAADDADSLTTTPAALLAPAADADGLTICAGTAWAYTMMNWA